ALVDDRELDRGASGEALFQDLLLDAVVVAAPAGDEQYLELLGGSRLGGGLGGVGGPGGGGVAGEQADGPDGERGGGERAEDTVHGVRPSRARRGAHIAASASRPADHRE